MNVSPLILNKIFNIFLILLFITSSIHLDQNLTNFILNYKSFFIIIYLISLSIILYNVINTLYLRKQELASIKTSQLTFKENLSQLNHEEKYILSLFLDKKTTEIALDPKSSSVQILEAQKVLFATSQMQGAKKIYRIQPNVYKLIRVNPNILY